MLLVVLFVWLCVCVHQANSNLMTRWNGLRCALFLHKLSRFLRNFKKNLACVCESWVCAPFAHLATINAATHFAYWTLICLISSNSSSSSRSKSKVSELSNCSLASETLFAFTQQTNRQRQTLTCSLRAHIFSLSSSSSSLSLLLH